MLRAGADVRRDGAGEFQIVRVRSAGLQSPGKAREQVGDAGGMFLGVNLEELRGLFGQLHRPFHRFHAVVLVDGRGETNFQIGAFRSGGGQLTAGDRARATAACCDGVAEPSGFGSAALPMILPLIILINSVLPPRDEDSNAQNH